MHPPATDSKPAPDYIALDNSEGRYELRENTFDVLDNGDEFGDNVFDEPWAKVLSIVYEDTVPPLCQEQIDLVDLILNGRNVFYTGSAGCGKSTVLSSLFLVYCQPALTNPPIILHQLLDHNHCSK